MGKFRSSSYTKREFFDGKHRFEHWYRDNTVYFITSRCRAGYPAFASEQAKQIFWDRFDFYTSKCDKAPQARDKAPDGRDRASLDDCPHDKAPHLRPDANAVPNGIAPDPFD